MAQTKLRRVAKDLTASAKGLTAIARKIRALDALGASLSEEQRAESFSKVVGELRAFRATVLQEVIDALSPTETVESE